MGLPINQLTRHARRAQFSIVAGGGTPVWNVQGGAPPAAPPGVPDAGAGGVETEAETETETEYSRLFRETFERLADLVNGSDDVKRLEFFHAMKLMQNFGLSSADVVKELDYGQENVCRWMNGTRCPHAEMRRHVLRTCLNILRVKLGLPSRAPVAGELRHRTL